jgi:hypothetical protein
MIREVETATYPAGAGLCTRMLTTVKFSDGGQEVLTQDERRRAVANGVIAKTYGNGRSVRIALSSGDRKTLKGDL